jgi:hypothetical protein
MVRTKAMHVQLAEGTCRAHRYLGLCSPAVVTFTLPTIALKSAALGHNTALSKSERLTKGTSFSIVQWSLVYEAIDAIMIFWLMIRLPLFLFMLCFQYHADNNFGDDSL